MRSVFPVGGLRKAEVREIATEAGYKHIAKQKEASFHRLISVSSISAEYGPVFYWEEGFPPLYQRGEVIIEMSILR